MVEDKLRNVPLDEEKLLERLYPTIGEKRIQQWWKQRYTDERGVQWTRYIGKPAWYSESKLTIEIQRREAV